MHTILAADIGGTNSRFAYFRSDTEGSLTLEGVQWLKTAESRSFVHLLTNLKKSGFSLQPEDADISVFAIAGPVEDGVRSSPPFISWNIDITDAHRCFKPGKALLINDFVAQAYACRSSHIFESAEKVKPGTPVSGASTAVIGAGTALGKAVLLQDDGGTCLAMPSEGGHASFPFETDDECRFRKFLIDELGDSYITWNKVVSGTGFAYIHKFLTGTTVSPEDFVHTVSHGSDTFLWASRFYGRACRNFALETLSLGGVFIAGGVAARTPEIVTSSVFSDEFVRSDTLAALLRSIPVFLVTDQNAGLWGAAVLGRQTLLQG